MGRRGPIPLEAADTALRGNTGHRKLSTAVRAPGRILPPPAWLSESARDIWRETIRAAPRDLLARCDAGILETYVIARDAYVRMAEQCNSNPWSYARLAESLGKVQAQMLKASQVLGFDPASRARLRVEAEDPSGHKPLDESDIFAEFKD